MPTTQQTFTSDASVSLYQQTFTSNASVSLQQLLFASNAQIGNVVPIVTYALPFTSNAWIAAEPPPGPGQNQLPANACEIASPCVDPANPVANFSAELPDKYIYIGYNYDPWTPNLGFEFVSTGCVGQCTSTVSQAEADMCAQSQQLICQGQDPTDGGNPGGGGYRNPGGVGTPNQFVNTEQSCLGAVCADGLPFIYTVPFGRVIGYSQFEANNRAHSLACQYARTHIVCLSSLTPGSPCVGSSYSGTITATGNTVDKVFGANFWQVVGGVFPPGLVFPTGFGGPSITITGAPTKSGVFQFTVRITTPTGDFMQKQFTFCILGVTFQGSLDPDDQHMPDGSLGQPYSQTLITASCAVTPLSWQVTGGQLPPGLTLDEQTGLISGTPTGSGMFPFTITLQDKAT